MSVTCSDCTLGIYHEHLRRQKREEIYAEIPDCIVRLSGHRKTRTRSTYGGKSLRQYFKLQTMNYFHALKFRRNDCRNQKIRTFKLGTYCTFVKPMIFKRFSISCYSSINHQNHLTKMRRLWKPVSTIEDEKRE